MRAAMFLAALAELERRGRLSYFDGLGPALAQCPSSHSVFGKKSLQCRRLMLYCPFFHLISQSGRAGRIGEIGLIRPSLILYRCTVCTSHAIALDDRS